MYQTGTNHIDTLLFSFQPHWSGNGSFDSPESVSFSFVPTISAYNNTPGDIEIVAG